MYGTGRIVYRKFEVKAWTVLMSERAAPLRKTVQGAVLRRIWC